MSEPVRRGRPGHDQQTVLRVAIELFNRQGYDATSMGDLARELGLTKSAIYHHVPSKEHLLERALDEALDGLTTALDTRARRHVGHDARTSGCAPRCAAASWCWSSTCPPSPCCCGCAATARSS